VNYTAVLVPVVVD